ncbi:hypothetical protein [Coleofasciculus chthonoplastes]|uniref:hypothetical protein n=1 Tax=Coleofasciculus chthonoplastes TaxID=64178 RepID=UPI0032F8090C
MSQPHNRVPLYARYFSGFASLSQVLVGNSSPVKGSGVLAYGCDASPLPITGVPLPTFQDGSDTGRN